MLETKYYRTHEHPIVFVETIYIVDLINTLENVTYYPLKVHV
jgi:hypothetical protein